MVAAKRSRLVDSGHPAETEHVHRCGRPRRGVSSQHAALEGETGGIMTGLRILIVAALIGALTTIGSGVAPGATTYWCFGQAATIVGTPGDDVLVGREDTADVIVGLGGSDIIRGSEDVTATTAPGDRLCGGPGADYIRGGVGEDRIQGGGGADDVDGSFSYDVITQGGPGNDRVADCDSEYTGGVRTISGGPGDDELCVDTDPARMYGNGGDDVLTDYDCSSDSRLSGGAGADRLESYFSNIEGTTCSEAGLLDSDTVVGGDGPDSAVVNNGDIVIGVETVQRR
jgi:Ca2+-binding RTX toxin-like protein